MVYYTIRRWIGSCSEYWKCQNDGDLNSFSETYCNRDCIIHYIIVVSYFFSKSNCMLHIRRKTALSEIVPEVLL